MVKLFILGGKAYQMADIVLLKDDGPSSCLIRIAEESNWLHVGCSLYKAVAILNGADVPELPDQVTLTSAAIWGEG